MVDYMEVRRLLRRERVLEYLDNMERQIKDIKSIPVDNREFFMNPQNTIQIKAIKYSLACAIQDLTRICVHIATVLSLWKVRESEAEAIIAIADAGIIPKEFAEKIKGMPAFRNRIIHDYLPNQFDAERLFENLKNLDDFKTFSKYIIRWLESL